MIERPKNVESTALSAAYLAGIALGIWTKNDIIRNKNIDKTFEPNMEKKKKIEKLYAGWKKAVKRTMKWEANE